MTTLFGYKTETAAWRERAEAAEAEIRRRDMDEVRTSIARREEEQRAADELAAQARAQRDADELEKHRRSAWFHHKLDEAVAGGDETFGRFLMRSVEQHMQDAPPAGFPPGVTADDFKTVPAPPAEPDPAVEHTPLAQALAKAGVRL